MGVLLVNTTTENYNNNTNTNYNIIMNHQQQQQQQQQGSQCTSTKMERRIIEKNRRNNMKVLYSNLYSLLPHRSSKEALTLPDQIDEAINHIKSMEAKLKSYEAKKERLTGRKRPLSSSSLNMNGTSSPPSSSPAARDRAPLIEIHEMGSVLEVVLICSSEDRFFFCEVLRVIQEEGADVITAKFSVSGDTVYHAINAEIGESMFMFGAAKITERLNRLVSGSSSDVELQPELWDFEIHPETLGLLI